MKRMGLIAVCVMLLACGGEIEEEQVGPAAEGPDLTDPDVLGSAIAADYERAMEDIVALIEHRPDPVEISHGVQELHDSYVELFVGYGRFYREMDSAERQAVDRKLTSAWSTMDGELFERYSDAASHYRGVDAELAELIQSFNIITQYYNYELLRQQYPDEADRLGL